jgi:hypothetical protein
MSPRHLASIASSLARPASFDLRPCHTMTFLLPLIPSSSTPSLFADGLEGHFIFDKDCPKEPRHHHITLPPSRLALLAPASLTSGLVTPLAFLLPLIPSPPHGRGDTLVAPAALSHRHAATHRRLNHSPPQPPLWSAEPGLHQQP